MARIKSRPTTLLGPGMGVNLTKNGYHQPTGSLPTYMTAPFVPVSQTSGTVSSAASTPIYATPQQAKIIYTIYALGFWIDSIVNIIVLSKT